MKTAALLVKIDSIILAAFMIAGCGEIHTTGKTLFADIKNKGASFVFYWQYMLNRKATGTHPPPSFCLSAA
jgi:hypothetical protein